MTSQDFYRIDSDLTIQRQLFPKLCKLGAPLLQLVCLVIRQLYNASASQQSLLDLELSN